MGGGHTEPRPGVFRSSRRKSLIYAYGRNRIGIDLNRWPIHRTTLLAAFVLTVLGQCAAPVAGAPDEARYGAGQGYPVGARNNWARPEFMVGSFTAMEQLFPVRAVPAGGAKRELPGHPTVVDWPFVQAYLDSHPVSGLLILKDGQVLQERYQYGRSAEHRFTSFSMAKTLVAMAVGVAVAEGSIASIDDPVNALDVALRKDIGKYQKHIADMELVDFKVRILNGGTGATTRVLVESRDSQGNRWFTVGVSANIVEASFQALQDAIIYKLQRDGVVA